MFDLAYLYVLFPVQTNSFAVFSTKRENSEVMEELKVLELMGESVMSFKIPIQFLWVLCDNCTCLCVNRTDRQTNREEKIDTPFLWMSQHVCRALRLYPACSSPLASEFHLFPSSLLLFLFLNIFFFYKQLFTFHWHVIDQNVCCDITWLGKLMVSALLSAA